MNLHILCTQLEVDESIFEMYGSDDWIGVDYGALMLIDHNIRPIAAFGDFDSIDETEKLRIESVIDIDLLPAEKNETDLEVAMQYAKDLEYNKVFIHGATGGRLDHFLETCRHYCIQKYYCRQANFISLMRIIRFRYLLQAHTLLNMNLIKVYILYSGE